MKLTSYFTTIQGTGVMATCNKKGVINTAIYAKPHVQGKDEVFFIMRDRLTHKNLQENQHASYLFLEEGQGHSGVRLFLTKIDESTDQELIATLSKRHLSPEDDKLHGDKFLIRFKVNMVLRLIGSEELTLE